MSIVLERLTKRYDGHPVVNRVSLQHTELLAEMLAGSYDLLVLGAPLLDESGRGARADMVSAFLRSAADHPVLIVRAPASGARTPWVGLHRQVQSTAEIMR